MQLSFTNAEMHENDVYEVTFYFQEWSTHEWETSLLILDNLFDFLYTPL